MLAVAVPAASEVPGGSTSSQTTRPIPKETTVRYPELTREIELPGGKRLLRATACLSYIEGNSTPHFSVTGEEVLRKPRPNDPNEGVIACGTLHDQTPPAGEESSYLARLRVQYGHSLARVSYQASKACGSNGSLRNPASADARFWMRASVCALGGRPRFGMLSKVSTETNDG